MKLVPADDPILRRVAEPVGEITPEVLERALELVHLLRDKRWIAVAAPQVGWSVRLFVTDELPRILNDGSYSVHVNPEVLARSDDGEREEEGCLSLPDQWVWVRRPRRIEIRETLLVLPIGHERLIECDREGPCVQHERLGFGARVFLHELDHLNGVLMTDHEEAR